MESSAEKSVRWFGTGMLVLGLSGASLLVAGFAPMLGANLGAIGDACAEPLLGEIRMLPLPFDAAQGPLSITATLRGKVDSLTAEIVHEGQVRASVPFDVRDDRAAAIWAGTDTAGDVLQAGTYIVRLHATGARCDETRETTIELRPSVVPFVELRVGDPLHLGTRLVQNDEDAGLRWSTSDPSIVEVEEDGTLRAKAPGTAIVKPRDEDGAGWTARPIEIRVVTTP